MLLGFLTGCDPETSDSRFASPLATFRTHQNAVSTEDWEAVWGCLSNSYKSTTFDNDFATWSAAFAAGDPKAELDREISEERIINERIAYLQFDQSTLPSKQSSPFFYFIREPDGWKMTDHLDTLFHTELEEAIEKGQFQLPD